MTERRSPTPTRTTRVATGVRRRDDASARLRRRPCHVRAEMRLTPRARARSCARARRAALGPLGTLRFALGGMGALAVRCTAAGLDLRVQSSTPRHTRRVRFRRGRGVLRGARPGTTPGVSARASNPPFRSPTRTRRKRGRRRACGVAKADLATHATCAALSAGEGAAGAAESTNPEPATWERGRSGRVPRLAAVAVLVWSLLDCACAADGRPSPTAIRRGDALRARLPPIRGGVRAEHDHADRGRSSRCLD